MSHTPGPWMVDEVDYGCRIIKGGKAGSHRQAQYTEIAATTGLYDNDTDRANARLIAAAPELLAALKSLADVSRSYIAHMDAEDIAALDSARAAIARANSK